MSRVVTIVAEPPQECKTCKKDFAIEAIYEKILREKAADHVLARAATLLDVKAILERESQPPPALVQIIGHGSPGFLLLGESWSLQDVHLPEGAVYELNSNVDDYLVLQGCVGEDTCVWLLGCEVGPVGQDGGVGDGPTLIFDLQRFWRCKAVCAPVTTVVDGDFEQGVYWPRETLSKAAELRVTLGREPSDPRWKTISSRPRAPGVGAERRAA